MPASIGRENARSHGRRSNRKPTLSRIQVCSANWRVKVFRVAAHSPPRSQHEILTHCFTMYDCSLNYHRELTEIQTRGARTVDTRAIHSPPALPGAAKILSKEMNMG